MRHPSHSCRRNPDERPAQIGENTETKTEAVAGKAGRRNQHLPVLELRQELGHRILQHKPATLVMGLVMEAMRNMAPGRMGVLAAPRHQGNNSGYLLAIDIALHRRAASPQPFRGEAAVLRVDTRRLGCKQDGAS